jgi:hypothetical protein
MIYIITLAPSPIFLFRRSRRRSETAGLYFRRLDPYIERSSPVAKGDRLPDYPKGKTQRSC